MSGEDAKAIADNWRYNDMGSELLPEHITALPRYHFWARTFQNDEPHVARVKCLAPIKRQGDEIARLRLVKQSLMRYANWKKDVRAAVMRQL